MVNQGNKMPGRGAETSKFSSHGRKSDNYTSDGVPAASAMELEGLSVAGKPPLQCNVHKGDAPTKTVMPESDAALREIADLQTSAKSTGVRGHEKGVKIPSEGFDDPANDQVS